MRHIFTIVGAALWLLFSSSAWANAVDVSVTSQTQMGQGLPTLHIHIDEKIAGFRVKLSRNDGKNFEFKGGGSPGVVRNIELAQPEGTFLYEGELVANFPNGTTSSMPLSFETQMYGPLKMQLEKSGVDLVQRRVGFTLSRAAGKAKVQVLMDTGQYAFDGEVVFQGEAPGTPLEISWPEAQGRVMRVSIQAFDTLTYFTGMEVFPWQVNIPHEEVQFDSGKWDIREKEYSKLEKSLGLIREAVEKYGHLATLKLYVLGHTDTVGTNASNVTLSNQRARSMGEFFRKKGLRIPIFYEGFGEDALLVSTADETSEEANRRAEYIISIEPPTLTRAPYAPKWRGL